MGEERAQIKGQAAIADLVSSGAEIRLLGHIDGVSLASSRRLATMAAVAFTGMDEVMGFPTSWAFGYSPYLPSGAQPRSGSAAFAHIDSGIAAAVMRNRFSADLTVVERIDRIVAATLS